MNRGCENLLLCTEYQSRNEKLPDELHRWQTNWQERWKSGESLNDAMGVYDSADERRYRRDIELKKFAALVALGSDSANAKFIAREVRKLRQRSRQCNEILKAIDAVFKIPSHPRHIYRILTNKPC